MTEHKVELPQGTVAYQDEGEGPVIVFSHGIFVDSSLWDGLVDRLIPAGFRCIRPETPLGCHRIPLNPETDLSPPAVADLLAEFIDALGLESPTIVGSDSGGAIAQMLAAQHPEMVGSLILNNCDALEVYPPFPFNALPAMAKMPGGIAPLSAVMRIGPIRRATYSVLVEGAIPDRQLKEWLEPSRTDPGIRRDITKLLAGVEKHQASEAAEKLHDFDKPVLLVWGTKDRIFKPELAERLAAKIPNARIEWIEGGKTFVQIDRPDEVADRIVRFLSKSEVAATPVA